MKGMAMGAKTGIEWCDSTWSPLRVRVKADAAQIARDKGYGSLVQIAEKMAGHVGAHCEHVSPGCLNCYAETNNHRCLPANGTGLPYDRRSRDLVEAFMDEKHLLLPLKWRTVKQGAGAGGQGLERPRRIFVENQSDLFGEWVTDEMLDRVFAVMAVCPQHVFQVLTKRPERMLEYFQSAAYVNVQLGACGIADVWLSQNGVNGFCSRLRNMGLSMSKNSHVVRADFDWPLSNVWLGVSVENQAAADKRIPLLLRTPAAVRFISAEPLLGSVFLDAFQKGTCVECDATGETAGHYFAEDGMAPCEKCGGKGDDPDNPSIDQVIAGGESGPGARPMHPANARSLRDQCVAAGVGFFFKQWGEWSPIDLWVPSEQAAPQVAIMPDGTGVPMDVNPDDVGGHRMMRVGKKAAGALLDGVEWKQFPAGCA